jgi:transposase, IS5 family
MRVKRIIQKSFQDSFPKSKRGREMAAMSILLDEAPEILDLVHRDLTANASAGAGRQGMTAEQVFRCAVLKHLQGFTYEDLEQFLQDSWSIRAFARLRPEQDPTDTTLQANIARIGPDTWEAINVLLVHLANKKAIEKGRKVRIDTTTVDTDIHHPTDASLLFDCIRVLTRLLVDGDGLRPAPGYDYSNHLRVAKKRLLAITNAKSDPERIQAYRDMVEIALNVAGYAQDALGTLHTWRGETELQRARGLWVSQEIRRVLEVLLRVVDQTRRRVFHGESVPAQEKVVSLFEEHTDIITKKRRETQFGHKVCLVTGASSMVLDCVIERGNPADSELFAKMLDRQEFLYGRPPRQSSADGGFASKGNLAAGKDKGVQDVCFAKKRGLSVEAMAKSPWVYRMLKDFRAGIEANISVLKRSFGLDCCTWSGWRGFVSYVWSAIIAYNLAVMARALLA